ncbi:MAG TPA: LuxR C-terminal-related transcriptional regulator [Rhodoblastus sp.]|nr:LuxR C-terminal-related transcriptional regulator [Rhodoblastus sp.]
MASVKNGQDKAAPLAPEGFPPPASGVRVDPDGVAPPAPLADQTQTAFELLSAVIEEAAERIEQRNVSLAAEVCELQMRALRSIHDSAQAAIELFEALGAAQTPRELAHRQLDLARRQREALNRRLAEFLLSARNIATMMADPLDARLRLRPGLTEPSDPEGLLARIEKLTARQKNVLELLVEGLPNKVIAHRLGITETTVKAHVGEILRKLNVYSRARAIVMLTQLDTTRALAGPSFDGED